VLLSKRSRLIANVGAIGMAGSGVGRQLAGSASANSGSVRATMKVRAARTFVIGGFLLFSWGCGDPDRQLRLV
jgi:hypothetical protein